MGCACNCWQSRKRRWCKHVSDDEGVADGIAAVTVSRVVVGAAPDGTVVAASAVLDAKAVGTDDGDDDDVFEAGNDDDDAVVAKDDDDDVADDNENELDVMVVAVWELDDKDEELLKPLLFWYTVVVAAINGVLGTCKNRKQKRKVKNIEESLCFVLWLYTHTKNLQCI